jgi:peptidoglycan/xylan/chitin deacetylase (PgdA/CDA1 family)
MGVTWSAIGFDWPWPADRITAHLLDSARAGAIFCLHDGRTLQSRPDISSTLGAVANFVSTLQDRGFRFETVSELVYAKAQPEA